MSAITFSQLFSKYNRVTIPMIQRDYAQGRKNQEQVRTNFILSLAQIINGKKGNLDFIYGTVEGEDFIPLDGQQRLTTLFLLYWLSASREERQEREYSFLKKFSYQTRLNSKYFCERLVEHTSDKYDPNKYTSIRKHILDQKWFRLDWEEDPTVDGMLRMLDCLNDKFYPNTEDISPIWDKLENICFFCYNIEDLGLTDDIYIKMNSRGKPLTEFEHFKAALDKATSSRLADEIDGEYTQLMWQLGNNSEYTASERNKNINFLPNVDSYLLNFFRAVNRIHCLSKDGSEPDDNPMEWISSWRSWIDLIEKAFDCYLSPEAEGVFERFFTDNAQNSKKINIDGPFKILDEICINGLSKASYQELIWFYSIILYLNHNRKFKNNSDLYIQETEIRRRLRILRNLLKNSENELRATRMPVIFSEVESLILYGDLSTGKNGFNDVQLNEELEKLEYVKNEPILEDSIAFIENHELLLGSLRTIGWKKPELFESFSEAFAEYSINSCLLTRAILTCGDFSYEEDSTYSRQRIGVGPKGSKALWREIFRTKDSRISKVLQDFLENYLSQKEKGESHLNILENMIKKYSPISFSDINYYIVKYPEILSHSQFGKFILDKGPYKMGLMALNSKLRPGHFWSTINLAIYHNWHPDENQKKLQLGNNGDFLYVEDCDFYLNCTTEKIEKYQLNSDGSYGLISQDSVKHIDRDVVRYVLTDVLPNL